MCKSHQWNEPDAPTGTRRRGRFKEEVATGIERKGKSLFDGCVIARFLPLRPAFDDFRFIHQAFPACSSHYKRRPKVTWVSTPSGDPLHYTLLSSRHNFYHQLLLFFPNPYSLYTKAHFHPSLYSNKNQPNPRRQKSTKTSLTVFHDDTRLAVGHV